MTAAQTASKKEQQQPPTTTAGSETEEGKATEVPAVFKKEDPKFMQKLRDGAKKIEDIKEKRKAMSADIQAVYANFEAEGLNRKAVKAAISYVGMDEDEQQNYDLSYKITRKALGKPVQGDLFEAAVVSELREKQKH